MFTSTFKMGFWISPGGVAFPVEETHINTVFNHPRLFGYTTKRLEAIYDRHGETYRSEAEARKEIIFALVRRGWIRLRHYPLTGWSVNVKELNPQYRYWITQFFRKVKAGTTPGDFVNIDPATEIFTFSIEAVCKGRLLRNGKSKNGRLTELRLLSEVPNK